MVHALSLVVMHPVRGVRQALDAVEVGHVVVLGLGELGAEVAVAFPPMTSVDAVMRRSAAAAFFGGVRTKDR